MSKTTEAGIATGAPDLDLDKLESEVRNYAACGYLRARVKNEDALALIEIARRAQPAGTGDLADEQAAFGNYFCMTLSCDGSESPELVEACRIAAEDAWMERAYRAALTHPSVSASPAMSNADAAQWARENGLNVPLQWEATQQPSAAPSVQPAGAQAQAQPDLLMAELIAAADATVERWHSRDWKQPHTGDFIARLAKAVGASKAALSASPSAPAVQAEPVYQAKVDFSNWCDIEQKDIANWQKMEFEVRTLYTGAAPAGAAQDQQQDMVDRNSALRAEPAGQHDADPRDVLNFAFTLAEKEDAFAAIGFLQAWNWEADDYLRAAWPEFAEFEAATRGRAEGGETSTESSKNLAAQTTTASASEYSAGAKAMIGTVMPCGACVTNVYEAYEAGRRAPAGGEVVRDAARYRWLRTQDWFAGPLCVLRDPKRVLTKGIGLGADCPSHHRLDAAIDAALSTMQQSTEGGV